MHLSNDTRGSSCGSHQVCEGLEGAVTLRVGWWWFGVVVLGARATLALGVLREGAFGLGEGLLIGVGRFRGARCGWRFVGRGRRLIALGGFRIEEVGRSYGRARGIVGLEHRGRAVLVRRRKAGKEGGERRRCSPVRNERRSSRARCLRGRVLGRRRLRSCPWALGGADDAVGGGSWRW